MKDSKGVWYDQYSGGSTNKVIKGQKLNSGATFAKVTKELEFRIFIKERIWRVVSLPDYQNIAELDKLDLINPLCEYYFGIEFDRSGGSVRIKEILEVDEFHERNFNKK